VGRGAGRYCKAGLCIGIFLFIFAGYVSAIDFSFRGVGFFSNQSPNSFFVEGAAAFSHKEGPITISGEFLAESRGTYPEPFLADFFGPFAVEIVNAGIEYNQGKLEFYLGKLPLEDEIESPYSLFLNGLSPSVMTGGFRYLSGDFYFSNRWIGLNRNIDSNLYQTTGTVIYEDRGAVLKSYSLDLGRVKLGYQDATIFRGSYFDVDVFAIPMVPSALIQAVLTASGRPSSRFGNQNSVMGFFGEYEADTWKLYAQLLVDDINMNRFLNPGAYQNPDKIAWAVGSIIELPLGSLSLHTAGATKYTFESAREEFYSYTLYPGSAVLSDGKIVSIPLQDQMLGYLHGENNIALMATWQASVWSLDLQTGLEFTLSGAKSPTNPWHNGESWSTLGGTQLLNDAVLQKQILLDLRGSKSWGGLTLFVATKLGYEFDKLNPVYPGDPAYPVYPIITETYGDMREPLYIPKAGDSGPVVELSLGGIWSFGL